MPRIKPFVPPFNVTGVAQMNDTLAGVSKYLFVYAVVESSLRVPIGFVNFTGSDCIRIRTSPSTGPFIRFNFKKNTVSAFYNTHVIMGSSSGDVPAQTFIDKLASLGVGNLPRCAGTIIRAVAISYKNVNVGTEGLRWGGIVSPVGAGFLGAGSTVVVVGILVMTGIVLGILKVGRKREVVL